MLRAGATPQRDADAAIVVTALLLLPLHVTIPRHHTVFMPLMPLPPIHDILAPLPAHSAIRHAIHCCCRLAALITLRACCYGAAGYARQRRHSAPPLLMLPWR